MKIPQKNWIQLNRGDRSGNLWATWNMILGDTIKPSPNTTVVFDDDDEINLGLVTRILKSEADGTNRWWALADGGRLFKSSTSSATSLWGQDDITDTPTLCRDAVNFRGDMIVSEDGNLSKLDGSTNAWDGSFWSNTLDQPSLLFAYNILLHVPDFLNNWLLVGNGNRLHVIVQNLSDDSYSVLGDGEGRIILPPDHTIEWIRSTSNRIWIGTSHPTDAKVFEWNARDQVPSNSYSVQGEKSFSGVELDDVIYTINNRGQLMGYSGSNFKEVARLPVANQPYFQSDKDSDLNKVVRLGDSAIVQRGMAVIDNKIHIFTNGEKAITAKQTIEEMPAGVYIFDENHGLYHAYGVGQTESNGTRLDYGAPQIMSSGAIEPHGSDDKNFLYGARIYLDEGSTASYTVGTRNGIASNRRGYIITSRILSSQVKQNFNKLWVVFNELRKDGEEIIVKFRNKKPPEYPIQDRGTNKISWIDTSTFTTDNPAYSDVEKGNEVLILNGRGAGTSVHIESISESEGTYTVNLDEAIPNVSGDALARVTNWRRIGTIDQQGIYSKDLGIPETSEWVQFKIELRSVSDSYDSPQIDKLELASSAGQNT